MGKISGRDQETAGRRTDFLEGEEDPREGRRRSQKELWQYSNIRLAASGVCDRQRNLRHKALADQPKRYENES